MFLNQGNAYTLECGTISGGPCDGDEIWSVGIYSGETQEGCLGLASGLAEINAISRKLYVNGKCSSRCSLGQAFDYWDPSISNTAIVPDLGRRNLDISDRKTKRSNLCKGELDTIFSIILYKHKFILKFNSSYSKTLENIG